MLSAKCCALLFTLATFASMLSHLSSSWEILCLILCAFAFLDSIADMTSNLFSFATSSKSTLACPSWAVTTHELQTVSSYFLQKNSSSFFSWPCREQIFVVLSHPRCHDLQNLSARELGGLYFLGVSYAQWYTLHTRTHSTENSRNLLLFVCRSFRIWLQWNCTPLWPTLLVSYWCESWRADLSPFDMDMLWHHGGRCFF